MPLHVITGAGATGVATAQLLAESGERVRIVSRSGRGPEHPLVERVAADVTDADRLTELLSGARTLYNCAAPAYDRWREEFPPLADALLTAAERAGTDYVMLGNIYGYGPFEGPLRPEQPMAPTTGKGRVRADMWHRALAAHEAGRVRVTEIRASDYLGPHAFSLYNLMVTPYLLAGEEALYPADLDVAHSWTYTGDVARTLVAAAAGPDEVWGRAWFVPSVSDASARELTARLAEVANTPAPRLERMGADALAQLAAQDSVMAEIEEMQYLDDRDCVLDASETEAVLGVKPAALDDVLREMADAARQSVGG
ncbi:NAD-dependent epimerase/dehydratase family protein [Streptodolium elevatio]|uniref:NAD-dependent epimerase/dehydratase family protein n=1 Tax=Streptodolium elevatio TaxID=3157996 RepID=A0ABV3DNK3_9ACTN